MQFLLDNLVALVVGTVLVAVLMVVVQRRQAESVSLAEHQIASGRAAALADWLQSDFQSLTTVTAWTDSTLTFWRSSDPESLDTAQVQYRRVQTSSAPRRYRIVRAEGGTEVAVGPVVSGWSVTLLTAGAQPTASPAAAAALRVRVVTVPPLTDGARAPAAVWERTFTPRMWGITNV